MAVRSRPRRAAACMAQRSPSFRRSGSASACGAQADRRTERGARRARRNRAPALPPAPVRSGSRENRGSDSARPLRSGRTRLPRQTARLGRRRPPAIRVHGVVSAGSALTPVLGCSTSRGSRAQWRFSGEKARHPNSHHIRNGTSDAHATGRCPSPRDGTPTSLWSPLAKRPGCHSGQGTKERAATVTNRR